MIDTVVLNIKFKPQYVFGDHIKRESGEVDLKECFKRGCKVMAGEIVDFNGVGNAEVTNLSSPWESIASSNSSVAFKVFQGGASYWPFVQVKGSVAKILQGHNVYGSDNPEQILCLIDALCFAMPDLIDMLDFKTVEIKQIDCTYSAHVKNQSIARQVIAACRNIHHGQTKVSNQEHDTSNYWGMSGKGVRTSRNKTLKQYLKFPEILNAIEKIEKDLGLVKSEPKLHKSGLIKKAKTTKKKTQNAYFEKQLKLLKSPEVQNYAKTAVRHEACVMPDMMKRMDIPTNLIEFMKYCRDEINGNVIQHMWAVAWSDILECFKGADMKVYTDDEIESKIKSKFVKVTPSGNLSYAKGIRLHKLYMDIKTYGWAKTKSMFSSSTFNDNVKLLMKVVPKAHLQNLNGIASNVTPIIKVINFDFINQCPVGYVEPDSLYQQHAENVLSFPLHRVA
ncbi:phage/plasmid replication protein, II/X family [Thalassotalea sp. ND16A]|uniref:phage/plasmid replication protein, II/X family n=1 Tax=Thalassotalea sp. ND16A TaxID=1535422 RepID=UPI000519F9A5|nr:phage/plasmid replication protein, II/X family [Thalassotalea sp. ND16A]KGK00280.1 DNA ligase (ATP) [Thalassotalea sp. ND16A]